MAVSKKDFVAEATDIRNNLANVVPANVLLRYVNARCDTLQAANPLFQRDAFEWACVSDAPKPRKTEK